MFAFPLLLVLDMASTMTAAPLPQATIKWKYTLRVPLDPIRTYTLASPLLGCPNKMDTIFVNTVPDSRLLALNASTGALLWNSSSITGSPPQFLKQADDCDLIFASFERNGPSIVARTMVNFVITQ